MHDGYYPFMDEASKPHSHTPFSQVYDSLTVIHLGENGPKPKLGLLTSKSMLLS